MKSYQMKAVSSLEGVLSSIDYDNKVYRWLKFLLLQPQVKQHLLSKPDVDKLYKALEQLLFTQRVACVLSLIVLSIIIFVKGFFFIWFSPFVLAFLFLNHNKEKEIIIKLSQILLQTDLQNRT